MCDMVIGFELGGGGPKGKGSREKVGITRLIPGRNNGEPGPSAPFSVEVPCHQITKPVPGL